MKRKGSKRFRVEEKPADDIQKGYMTKLPDIATSQKRMRINQSLTSKLHTLTNVEQKFPAVLTPGRITGAKNNNIWDFKIALLQHEMSLGSGTASVTSSVMISSVQPTVKK